VSTFRGARFRQSEDADVSVLSFFNSNALAKTMQPITGTGKLICIALLRLVS
jgi:hypothetical protein